MDIDDHICLCFRISRRKLINFVNREHPKVASQLSQCGGAGTGCGWCIPFLKQIFAQQQNADATTNLDTMTAEEYASARKIYHKETGKKPPNEE